MNEVSGKEELNAIIQEWDDNGLTKLGQFYDLVDALWAAGYRRTGPSDE